MLIEIINWSNLNSGFLGLAIFIATLVFGWLTGIIRFLRHKPEFKIRIIPGPTFCSVVTNGQMSEGYHMHRTAIAVYLGVANIGSAGSSIENVQLGFHWHLTPFSWLWLRYKIGWYWIGHPTTVLEDFQVKIGEDTKIYPSLLQAAQVTGKDRNTLLEAGRSSNGVVYFETTDSWGGCFPSPDKDGKIKIRVAVVDVYGKKHKNTFTIPIVPLVEARKYNPSFGATHAALRNENDLSDFFETLNK